MKITRSTSDSVIAGVCSGLARHLGWSSKRVRIIWALLTLFSVGLPGIIAYLVLWYLMPAGE
ncbi:MAG: PspC domain-containing protein [Opitutaceae bacterium]|jgi:phage shock protein C